MRLATPVVALLAMAGALEAAPAETVRSGELEYRFVVRDLPPNARAVAAYVPVPPSNSRQTLAGYRVEADYPYRELLEGEYGNRYLRFDLSGATQEVSIALVYRVKRWVATAAPAAGERPARFLAADRLVPVDGKIAEEARRVAGEVRDPLQRARRLYDHIVATVRYDKSGRGWGRGDAEYACDARAGNCTDFHSLFIGEARSLGIPARFIMGVPLPEEKSDGVIAGYHCWAEFFVAGVGWLPVDASEASKFPDKKDALFGRLDANRIEFTAGRDIVLPGSQTGPVNYSIYPHVEVDGAVHDNVETKFSFRELPEDGVLGALQKFRAPAAFAWLVVLLGWESAAPFFDHFRRRIGVRAAHGMRNLAVGFVNNLVASVGFVGLWTLAGQWSEAHQFGLLHRLELPGWAHVLCAVLILDCWTYFWQRLNHRVPFLWRFHRLHHSRFQPETDSNFTASLSVWDRLFGTLRFNPRPDSIRLGLDGLDDPRHQGFSGLLVSPFRSNRPR
jgi:hypothetical protein